MCSVRDGGERPAPVSIKKDIYHMQWSGLKDAQTFDRGTYFKPGAFTLKVLNCLTKQTQKSGEGFIVEFEVMETSDPVNHAVGSKGSWFQSLKNQQVAFGAVKEFLAAVYGYDLRGPGKALFEAQMVPQIEAYAAAASDGRNNLAGRLVRLQTEQVMTLKNTPFTRHTWSPAPRAAAGGAAV